jgi:hypothetical protein
MALAHAAGKAVVPSGACFMIAFVQEARGLTALAEGRYDEAYDRLRRMYDRADPAHQRALCCWFAGDFAEAAVHSGHRDVARCVIGDLTPLTGQTPSSWIEASMRFAQAQLADDADVERLFCSRSIRRAVVGRCSEPATSSRMAPRCVGGAASRNRRRIAGCERCI